MSILIKDMEMPNEGEYHMTFYVCSDGSAYIDVASFPADEDKFEAVPVPPHGRLIDADELLGHMKKIHDKWKLEGHYTPTTDDEIMTMNMPTIIEAEE